MMPRFGEKAMKEFEGLKPIFDNPKSRLIPTLALAQREFGYLSPEVIEYVAGLMGLTPAKVMEAASFYTMLHKKPVGKYEIQVCLNISCALMKSRELFSHLKKKLSIDDGGITQDKKFTLTRVECLGACDKAPAIRINNVYHYGVSLDKMTEILSKLK
jgi:NADH-quinone oxidoreductase E subunit